MSSEIVPASGSLKDLKEFLQGLQFELTHIQHTERGTVLALGALLDTKLRDCIKAWTANSTAVHKDAFGERGLLGGMANKIQFLFLIGAYSEAFYNELTIVARIRNRFAHEFEVDSFDHPRVKAQAENLHFFMEPIHVTKDGVLQSDTSFTEFMSPFAGYGFKTLRERYVGTVAALAIFVELLSTEVPDLRRHRISI